MNIAGIQIRDGLVILFPFLQPINLWLLERSEIVYFEVYGYVLVGWDLNLIRIGPSHDEWFVYVIFLVLT
jgi:hypothetical protein